MEIYSYTIQGFEGALITVEADLRRGIPGTSIIGLPKGSLRESSERLRIAVNNSGFQYPLEKILINLYPSDFEKRESAIDLAIAVKILEQAGHFPQSDLKMMVMGELQLSGNVRKARGVLPAIRKGLESGIEFFIIPKENGEESAFIETGTIFPVSSLQQAAQVISSLSSGECPSVPKNDFPRIGDTVSKNGVGNTLDFSEMENSGVLKRIATACAAGFHNLFLFGPPGCGKTMCALRLPSIFPQLENQQALESTCLYSIAGKLDSTPFISYPPFRMPHHSCTLEGMIGGGDPVLPGEISLAHNGILFLDEACEFKPTILQSLREPAEKERVFIARAANHLWFPSSFLLVMAVNLCPCGNYGKEGDICLCSDKEISRYWNKIGGALLDRVDLRYTPLFPFQQRDSDLYEGYEDKGSEELKEFVYLARERQSFRYRKLFDDPKILNGRIAESLLLKSVILKSDLELYFREKSRVSALSARGRHSVLKIAQTLADIDSTDLIEKHHLTEAFLYRTCGNTHPKFSYLTQ